MFWSIVVVGNLTSYFNFDYFQVCIPLSFTFSISEPLVSHIVWFCGSRLHDHFQACDSVQKVNNVMLHWMFPLQIVCVAPSSSCMCMSEIK